MTNRKNNIDDSIDILDDSNEFEIMEKGLNQYLVKYPDEQMINATIDTLRQYVPNKKKQSRKNNDRFLMLMKHTGMEFSLISKWYWLASTILFVLGYLITINTASNPLLTLVILAPVPFILGLVEVFKGREQGLLEMEMACKFSAYEIMLSRLLLISLFNITLNTLLTFGFNPLLDSTTMMEMLLVWFTPLTIFSAISLWLSMMFRGVMFVMTFASIWVFFSILVVSNPAWRDFILNMHIALHFLFVGIGITMFAFQIKRLIKKYSSYEGAETIEVSH